MAQKIRGNLLKENQPMTVTDMPKHAGRMRP